MTQDNIRTIYQLVAVSKPDVGTVALTVRDKQVYSDLISTNKRKADFLKETEAALVEQGVKWSGVWNMVRIDPLELHQ